MLNCLYGIHLGLKEVLYAYTIKRHRSGKYYFVADAKPLQLVVNLPYINKNKSQGNVLVFDAWGCARDPMLLEFGLNLNSSQVGCWVVVWSYA